MKKNIKVVDTIIENENNEILCALRSPNMSLPNMWEFPGGKVEKGENLTTDLGGSATTDEFTNEILKYIK